MIKNNFNKDLENIQTFLNNINVYIYYFDLFQTKKQTKITATSRPAAQVLKHPKVQEEIPTTPQNKMMASHQNVGFYK